MHSLHGNTGGIPLNVIAFPTTRVAPIPQVDLDLVRMAVVQGSAEVEHWARVLGDLKDKLLLATQCLEEECRRLGPSNRDG